MFVAIASDDVRDSYTGDNGEEIPCYPVFINSDKLKVEEQIRDYLLTLFKKGDFFLPSYRVFESNHSYPLSATATLTLKMQGPNPFKD